jgi:hypothetical protein
MSGAGINNVRDVTARQSSGGEGMDMRRTFALCPLSHKGLTTGAQYVRGLGYVRCPACNAKRKAG